MSVYWTESGPDSAVGLPTPPEPWLGEAAGRSAGRVGGRLAVGQPAGWLVGPVSRPELDVYINDKGSSLLVMFDFRVYDFVVGVVQGYHHVGT